MFKFDNITKLYLTKFFLSLHFIGAVLIPFFMEWGRLTYMQTMLLQSIFVISVTLFEVPTGAVADHYGRRISISIGIIVNILGIIAYTIKPDFFIFVIAEILWALAYALVSGADHALLYDTLKEEKKEKESKKILGKFGSIELIGILIAAPIGSLIAQYFGIVWATKAMIIPFFFSLLISFTIKEPKIKGKENNYFDTLKSGLSYFKNNKKLKILVFDAVSIFSFSLLIIWTYQLLLKDFNIPIGYFGIIHAIAVLFEVIIMNNFDNLEKMFGSKKKYILFSALVVGFSYLLLAFSTSIYLSIPLILIVFGIGITRMTLFTNYLNKFIESHHRATVLSTVSMFAKFGSGLLYPLVGFITENYSLSLTFFSLGILVLISTTFSKVREDMLID
ncbi:MFS transporter [archaeon]|jgi:MFS family permease|nr:MFS transporter [archaeon]MBT4352262.1 MFS transporter [archaeon]MBT4647146.1 MFS transporter [archaeon]MBT6822149.1 MFS transporter [archaeon]MBT7391776.1 MFS transporter [archaeon]